MLVTGRVVTGKCRLGGPEQGGRWKRALFLLKRMHADGFPPGADAYTSTMGACLTCSFDNIK